MKVTTNYRMSVSSHPEGEVRLVYPFPLSRQSIEELESFLALQLRVLTRVADGIVKAQEEADAIPAGLVDGVLYCYGRCGTRYSDFPRDLNLPTGLWNRIAVGTPFDESEQKIDREGRGGVLCPACIVARLAALPDCTSLHMEIR
jgi:hypothetical protein